MSVLELANEYFQLGFTHVLPLGLDHILFILSLYLLNPNLKTVIIQCSVFTLAHSITLFLSASGYLLPDSKIIEPLIAISILVTAIENIAHNNLNKWRLIIISAFGLIHGMGFANALKEIGLPQAHFLNALLFFNIGVELGQITVILIAYILITKWFSKKTWYKERIVYPISSIIACIALYWTIERLV